MAGSLLGRARPDPAAFLPGDEYGITRAHLKIAVLTTPALCVDANFSEINVAQFLAAEK